MSAQSTIQKLREQNAVMAALLKRASGEPLNADERTVIEEFAKARALEQRLREKYDLGGAIEKVLRNPRPQTALTQGAAELFATPEDLCKDAAQRREQSGLGGVNWKDGVDLTGKEPTRKNAPAPKLKNKLW